MIGGEWWGIGMGRSGAGMASFSPSLPRLLSLSLLGCLLNRALSVWAARRGEGKPELIWSELSIGQLI